MPYKRFLIPVVCLVTATALFACAPAFVSSDPENMTSFAQSSRLANGMHVVTGGSPGAPMVLFVHGTPGSWHAFEEYLQHPRLRDEVFMVAVDRAGFGKSGEMALEPLLSRQSELLADAIALNTSPQKILLVGHSLGGSIGLRSAIDHPKNVGGLLAISSAISAELGQPRWYNRVADLPIIKHIIPRDLHFANEEILPLSRELAELDLGQIQIPVTVIQGDKDPLVNRGNAIYAEENLTNAEFKLDRFPEEGHFIVWSHVDHVVDEILRLVARIREIEGTNPNLDGHTTRVGQ